VSSVRFLVDAQLPPALVGLLREHGHVAEHVTEIGPADAPDSDLWKYALENDAVIVTKDEDFADMVAIGRDGPVVVWVRVGNTRGAALLVWFEPLIDHIVELVSTGQRLVEFR
jgi:predicted nuclease of predicted toxin-antitoxin system